MALALPKLDNRTYDELVREAQRLLPRHAPQWTDHNVHDPGITLIELFSWMVEQDIYRLDRTPDASVRAFLRLVGITPRPPQVATTVLELSPKTGAGALDLPVGLQVSNADDFIRFETDTDVHLTEARLVEIKSLTGAGPIDQSRENATAGTYLPFGANPEDNHALLLGFDAPLGRGGETIVLHLWSAEPETDAETRSRLIEESRQRRHEVETGCPPGRRPELPDWRRHYSARTLWEYPNNAGSWKVLEAVEDETRGLSLSGFVRFRVPTDQAMNGLSPGLWVLRCRLISGGYECPPVIDRMGVNAVSASHATLMRTTETLGPSKGHAGETYKLASGSVVAGSVQLQVVQDGKDEVWEELAEWDRVGPHDRVFRLDPDRVQISFGDGRIGRAPPAGATLLCRYRVGGGSEGNVGAGTLTTAQNIPVEVHQPFSAFGGAMAETLDDARGRALAFLAERRRAITLGDLEALALSTPGVPVARARALAGHHPNLPCVNAAGSLTLVAVPSCPGARPEASPDFLAAVYRWLLPRCALTTELHVIGPSYRVVGVEARLHAEAGADEDALVQKAMTELERFFHPLEGGPDGAGWPVGRTVYSIEVLAVLNGIDGVAYVDQLRLSAEGETEASCTNVRLCAEQMAAAGEHRIQVVPRRQVR